MRRGFALLLVAGCASVPPAEKAREHYRQGFMYLQMGDDAKAEAEFLKAAKLDTTFAEAYCRLGVIYAGRKDYAKASENLQRALKLNPKYAEAHYYYGLIVMEQGDTAKGLAELEAAVEADSSHTPSVELLAQLYAQRGEYEKAYPLWKRIAQRRTDPNTLYTFGSIALMTGHYDEAAEAAHKALQQADTPDLHLLLAYALAQQGRYTEAALEARVAAAGFRKAGRDADAAKAEKLLKMLKK